MPTINLTEHARQAMYRQHTELAHAAAIECPTARGLTNQWCPCHPEPSMIHPTAVIEGHIGEGTHVGAHAWIGPLVTIGHGCRVGPGARIGQDGFGYINTITGEWEHKPQTHGVIIADDVHIGANTCIDRGSYRDTTIGRGTKIDNLVHIAHNAMVGEDCLIIAQAMIAGSVVIGDGAYIAPCASVREHTTIGAGAFVALGAVVTSNVSDGEHVKGIPAKAFQPTEASRAAKSARRHMAA